MTTFLLGSDGGDDYTDWTTMQLTESESDGDTVSFRKGETFREQITVPASGSSTSSVITYNAHGAGADPIINGSDLVETWADTFTAGSCNGDKIDDDFDDNDITDWTTQNATAQNQRVEMSPTGGGGDWFYQDVTDLTEYWVSLKMQLVSGYSFETGNSIQGKQIKNGAGLGYRESGGSIYWMVFYYDDAGDTFVTQATGPTDNTWHDVLIYWKASTGEGNDDGIVTIWVDNVQLYTKTDIDSDTRTCSRGHMGNNNSSAAITATMYVDDVKMGTGGSAPVGTENVWSATLTTEPYVVMFDGTLGVGDATPDAEFDWYWDSNTLYCYSTTDPDTAYDDPGVEASIRDSAILASSKDYITIDGIAAKITNGNVISFDGCQYGIAQNCTVEYCYKGIQLKGESQNCTIDTNTISYIVLDGIWTYKGSDAYSCSGLTIKGNTVSNCGHYGINTSYTSSGALTIESNSVDTVGYLTADKSGIGILEATGTTIVRYNIVTGVSLAEGAPNGHGINIDTNADDAQVYYNISYSNQGSGIMIWQAETATVYNNVCYDNANTGSANNRAGISICSTAASATVKNNICYNNYANIKVDGDADTGNITIDYNQYYPDTGTKFQWDGSDYNFADWKTNSSQDANSPAIADPTFTNAASADFTLLVGSPCINAGVDVSLTTDYAGNIVGALPDIGAYELIGAISTIPPMMSGDYYLALG